MLDLKKIERISKALGDPYRLKIMQAVNKEHECLHCVSIIGMLDLAQSTVSHHIKQLVDADLLIVEKDGRNTKYQVNKDTMTEYTNFLNSFKL